MFIYIILWTIWTGLLCMYVCMPTCLLAKVARREIEDQWQLEWQWQPCDQLMSICLPVSVWSRYIHVSYYKGCQEGVRTSASVRVGVTVVWSTDVCLCGVFMSMCPCFCQEGVRTSMAVRVGVTAVWSANICLFDSLSLCLSVCVEYVYPCVCVCMSV